MPPTPEKPKLERVPGIYQIPVPAYPWEAEMGAFRYGLTPPRGLGRYEHLMRYLAYFWPTEVCSHARPCPRCREAGKILHPLKWNPWTERTLRELCDDSSAITRAGVRVKVNALTGAATASKTWSCGLYAFAWWAASPHNSIVMFTSTTKEMIQRRIWPVVQHFFDAAVDPLHGGPMSGPDGTWGWAKKTESRTSIDYVNDQGTTSKKNSIFAMAVAHGETQKAAHNLRGLHDERMLLIIDEANGTPEAIFDAIPNQRKGCRDYQVVIIGNPISHLDPHGQACQPAQGWGIVTEGAKRWHTKGVDKWQLDSGVCLRFDGKDSPNVKLGRDQWPFIYTTADWARACDPKHEKTLAYWSQDRGLWPPDGQCRTIVSEAMLAKYDPEDGPSFRWISKKRMIAFLDPAFGGDDCMLYFAEVGDIEGGMEAIQVIEAKALTFEAVAKDERDYLVARQTIEECKAKHVKPVDFGLDRTGTGRGVAAIISAEWSSSIVQVEFGAVASDMPSSTADGRPAREVYANTVTEMWWGCREYLEAGQLRGIPLQARIELTTREYEWNGRKYRLEPKDKFKERFGYSPDDGDALSGLGHVAKLRGVRADTAASRATDTAWDELVQQQINDNAEDRVDVNEGARRGALVDAWGQQLEMFPHGVEEDDWA